MDKITFNTSTNILNVFYNKDANQSTLNNNKPFQKINIAPNLKKKLFTEDH